MLKCATEKIRETYPGTLSAIWIQFTIRDYIDVQKSLCDNGPEPVSLYRPNNILEAFRSNLSTVAS